MSDVEDQGDLGGSACFAVGYLLGYSKGFKPSHLYMYYNEHKYGVCNEYLWPYNEKNISILPPKECYRSARYKRGILYLRLKCSLEDLKGCLEHHGPFVCRLLIYESFNNSGGDVPIPGDVERCLGSHVVCVCGFDDIKRRFIFMGVSWGNGGYGSLPYEYVLSADDFWIVERPVKYRLTGV